MPPECEACQAAAGLGAFETWIRPERVVRTAGRRSGDLADTKLICGAGPFEVDVLVREFARAEGLEFHGQVTWAERVHEPVTGIPVALITPARNAVLGDAATNEFGEFDLRSPPMAQVGLRIGDAPDAPCLLVWEAFS